MLRQWLPPRALQHGARAVSRAYSTSKLNDIDPSRLTVTKAIASKELIAPKDLVFGRTFTGDRLCAPQSFEQY